MSRDQCQQFLAEAIQRTPGLNHPGYWFDHLLDELVFWHQHISGDNKWWYRDFIRGWAARSADFPHHRFEFGHLLPQRPADRLVEVLDVGSGPLPAFGASWPGHHVRLTRADPLSVAYFRLLSSLGLDAPMAASVPVLAELLHLRFRPEQFHLVHARNALDHSADPLAAIVAMIIACKPGGAVVLRHYENEAKFCGYGGLHRWNFSIDDDEGQPVVWNEQEVYYLEDLLPEAGHWTARRYQGTEPKPRTWVEMVLRRI